MKNFRLTYLLFSVAFSGAAAATYISGMCHKSWILLVVMIIFSLGGVGYLTAFVLNSISKIKNSKIERFGRNGTGIYLKHKEVVAVNEVPYYKIYFSFKNDSGKEIETKTRGTVYRRYEAEALALIQTFPIRYIDDNAIIKAEKYTLLEIFYENKMKKFNFR